MLFDPARHQALAAADWDADVARVAIDRIVQATHAARDATGAWPVHPLDADGADEGPAFNLYFGAAGVAWALVDLERRGLAAPRGGCADDLDMYVARNRAWLDAGGSSAADHASYLMGETGILLLRHAVAPEARTAARLAALIEGNVHHPARELMWGAPGTMLAARFLHASTGGEHWAELFRASARVLWSALTWRGEPRIGYWTQDLYGRRYSFLDAVHGFVATASVLIDGRALLDADEWTAWERCIVDTVSRTARREGSGVNWPIYADAEDRRRDDKVLMQFCHGAPGFVIALSRLPSVALDADLAAAGEAIWAAGPLAKGANLCHGTAGNGYAFLGLFARTGDARWLARARAFAMHAIGQMDAHAAVHGQHRYSLWTGDLGLAVYLADCIAGHGAFPTLQTF